MEIIIMKTFYFTENNEQLRKDLYKHTSCKIGSGGYENQTLLYWDKSLTSEALALDFDLTVYQEFDVKGMLTHSKALYYLSNGGIYIDNEAFIDVAKQLYPKIVDIPQDDDLIYYIDGKGNIRYEPYNYTFEIALDMGNIFRTYSDATKEFQIRLALTTVNNEIKKLNAGWTPDYTDDKIKYHIVLAYGIFKRQGQIPKNYNTKLLPLKLPSSADYIIENYFHELNIIFGVNDD